jgi:hypothetical protein
VPSNRSPGQIFGDPCSVLRAGAVGHSLGPNSGRQFTEAQQTKTYVLTS